MAATNTSTAFLMLLLAILAPHTSAQNITNVLKAYPQFSTLNKLLSETGVADQINSRKSLTILAPDNSVLDPIVVKLGPTLSTQQLEYILDYHVLLQYFDLPELHQIVKGTTQVTTLYQTTGNAQGTFGFVNITDSKGGNLLVSTPSVNDASTATIMRSVKQIPYNYSIFEISAVIVPVGVLSQTSQPTPAPAPISVPSPVSASAPSPLSPVPIASPVPAPASSPESVAAPIPSPETAPVPSAAPISTPSIAPAKSPVSSPPAPPVLEGPSTAETPSPSKSSPLCSAISFALTNMGVFLGVALPFLLQL